MEHLAVKPTVQPSLQLVTKPARLELTLGLALVLLAALMVWGARSISTEAGYSGISPAFVPHLVAAVLGVCGAWLAFEGWRGGFSNFSLDDNAAPQVPRRWVGFALMSAGLLLNALIINRLGFVLACTVVFAFGARAMRDAQPPKQYAYDLLLGFALSLPTYWVFTKGLSINLPGLTETGWI